MDEYEILKEMNGNLILQNKQLRRANIKKDKQIKYLRRVITKLKEEGGKKQHYKNRRRGSRFNG